MVLYNADYLTATNKCTKIVYSVADLIVVMLYAYSDCDNFNLRHCLPPVAKSRIFSPPKPYTGDRM